MSNANGDALPITALLDDNEIATIIASELATMDGYEPGDVHSGLHDLQWSGGCNPEPLGDEWSLTYEPKGWRIAKALRTAASANLDEYSAAQPAPEYREPTLEDAARAWRIYNKALTKTCAGDMLVALRAGGFVVREEGK
jgi:hypothetical protein